MKITVIPELSDEDIQAAIPRFRQAWHKTVEGLFEMIDLVKEYSDRSGYQRLAEELEKAGIIKRSVLKMLKQITLNPFLMEEHNRPFLPPAYNTLWVLSSLKPQLLEIKKKKNEISSDLRLETARLWKSNEKTVTKQETTIAIASVRMSAGRYRRNKTAIHELLDGLEELGATVTLSKRLP